MKLTDSTVFMTGGTSGIGLELALRLRDLGNRVIVSGRRKALLDQLAAEQPGIGTVVLDVGDPGSITAAARTVAADHPDLTTVITMAGIAAPENLLDPDQPAAAERIVTVNLLGTIRTVAAFVPVLTGRPDATVVTVGSGLAYVPLTSTPTYSATKAAVHSYTQSLRVQLAPAGIQVTELIPPAVQTELLPGQSKDEHAMPLTQYVDEVLALLQANPAAGEIQVDRVEFLSQAAREGRYDETFAMLNTTF